MAARNLERVDVVLADLVNTYQMLRHKQVVITSGYEDPLSRFGRKAVRMKNSDLIKAVLLTEEELDFQKKNKYLSRVI